LQRFQRSVVNHPPEGIAGNDERIILIINFIGFDGVTRGRCERFKTIAIKFPGRIIHARPVQP
jgi:hypothetical protein